MSNRLTRADIIEVPLPDSFDQGTCMPLVVMQPTADASDYMLKPNYATNGRPGVVDHAVIADQANTVIWNQITNLPTVFPPAKHGASHLDNGLDVIPVATTSRTGLVPIGTGQPNDYLGGDLQFHNLQSLAFIRSEGDATLDPSLTAGSTIFTGIVPNPAYGNYTIHAFYLYNANPSYPPAGKVHFGIYDPAIPGWVQCTDSSDISVLTNRYSLLRPPLNVTAMNRVFGGAGNAFQWRLVLDVPSGTASYVRVGAGFLVLLFPNPLA
jgi:hypothetical protein